MKKKIWITVFVLVLLTAGAVFALREITFAHYEGSREAAQLALDNTMMQKIDDAVPYTAGMNGYLFTGTDEQGKVLYAWVADGKVVGSQYAESGLSEEKAIAAAKKPVWAKALADEKLRQTQLQPVVEVLRIHPGPVLAGSKVQYRTAPSRYVWEIYGTLANGHNGYTYLDYKSGEVVWQVELQDPK